MSSVIIYRTVGRQGTVLDAEQITEIELDPGVDPQELVEMYGGDFFVLEQI